MTRRDMSIRKGEEHIRHLNRMVLGLEVVVILGGSLALVGCGGSSLVQPHGVSRGLRP
jgi:hypothetical protein